MGKERGADGAEAAADARAASGARPAAGPLPAELPAGVDVEALRRAYEEGTEDVASIRARAGLTEWQFRRLRETQQWAPRPFASGAAVKPGDFPKRRLERIAAAGIASLAREIADAGWNGDSARKLLELCRAREMIMRSGKSGKTAEAREKKNKADERRDPTDDPAWVRAELERRILQIRRARGLEGGPRPGDG
jgi:hypothetical protein